MKSIQTPVQPSDLSTAFVVIAESAVNVHVGPGTEYADDGANPNEPEIKPGDEITLYPLSDRLTDNGVSWWGYVDYRNAHGVLFGGWVDMHILKYRPKT